MNFLDQFLGYKSGVKAPKRDASLESSKDTSRDKSIASQQTDPSKAFKTPLKVSNTKNNTSERDSLPSTSSSSLVSSSSLSNGSIKKTLETTTTSAASVESKTTSVSKLVMKCEMKGNDKNTKVHPLFVRNKESNVLMTGEKKENAEPKSTIKDKQVKERSDRPPKQSAKGVQPVMQTPFNNKRLDQEVVTAEQKPKRKSSAMSDSGVKNGKDKAKVEVINITDDTPARHDKNNQKLKLSSTSGSSSSSSSSSSLKGKSGEIPTEKVASFFMTPSQRQEQNEKRQKELLELENLRKQQKFEENYLKQKKEAKALSAQFANAKGATSEFFKKRPAATGPGGLKRENSSTKGTASRTSSSSSKDSLLDGPIPIEVLFPSLQHLNAVTTSFHIDAVISSTASIPTRRVSSITSNTTLGDVTTTNVQIISSKSCNMGPSPLGLEFSRAMRVERSLWGSSVLRAMWTLYHSSMTMDYRKSSSLDNGKGSTSIDLTIDSKSPSSSSVVSQPKMNISCGREQEMWADKYRPRCASDVLGNTSEVQCIHEWLQYWAGKRRAPRPKKRKRKGRNKTRSHASDWDDGRSQSPGMSNLMVVSGASGSGKTSAIYACAMEVGFHVLEINAGQDCSGKEVKKMVTEATQSQGVQLDKMDTRIQATGTSKAGNGQLSLILFEDADLSIPIDTGFQAAILYIAKVAKCPILLTTHEERPMEFLRSSSVNAPILVRFQLPNPMDILQFLSKVTQSCMAGKGEASAVDKMEMETKTEIVDMVDKSEMVVVDERLKLLSVMAHGDIKASLANLQVSLINSNPLFSSTGSTKINESKPSGFGEWLTSKGVDFACFDHVHTDAASALVENKEQTSTYVEGKEGKTELVAYPVVIDVEPRVVSAQIGQVINVTGRNFTQLQPSSSSSPSSSQLMEVSVEVRSVGRTPMIFKAILLSDNELAFTLPPLDLSESELCWFGTIVVKLSNGHATLSSEACGLGQSWLSIYHESKKPMYPMLSFSVKPSRSLLRRSNSHGDDGDDDDDFADQVISGVEEPIDWESSLRYQTLQTILHWMNDTDGSQEKKGTDGMSNARPAKKSRKLNRKSTTSSDDSDDDFINHDVTEKKTKTKIISRGRTSKISRSRVVESDDSDINEEVPTSLEATTTKDVPGTSTGTAAIADDADADGRNKQAELFDKPSLSMLELLCALIAHPYAEPFLEPLNDLKGYSKVISEPMDLWTIVESIHEGLYIGNTDRDCDLTVESDTAWAAMVADVRLVWSNCRAFNGNSDDLSRYADILSDCFEAALPSHVATAIGGRLPETGQLKTLNDAQTQDEQITISSTVIFDWRNTLFGTSITESESNVPISTDAQDAATEAFIKAPVVVPGVPLTEEECTLLPTPNATATSDLIGMAETKKRLQDVGATSTSGFTGLEYSNFKATPRLLRLSEANASTMDGDIQVLSAIADRYANISDIDCFGASASTVFMESVLNDLPVVEEVEFSDYDKLHLSDEEQCWIRTDNIHGEACPTPLVDGQSHDSCDIGDVLQLLGGSRLVSSMQSIKNAGQLSLKFGEQMKAFLFRDTADGDNSDNKRTQVEGITEESGNKSNIIAVGEKQEESDPVKDIDNALYDTESDEEEEFDDLDSIDEWQEDDIVAEAKMGIHVDLSVELMKNEQALRDCLGVTSTKGSGSLTFKRSDLSFLFYDNRRAFRSIFLKKIFRPGANTVFDINRDNMFPKSTDPILSSYQHSWATLTCTIVPMIALMLQAQQVPDETVRRSRSRYAWDVGTGRIGSVREGMRFCHIARMLRQSDGILESLMNIGAFAPDLVFV